MKIWLFCLVLTGYLAALLINPQVVQLLEFVLLSALLAVTVVDAAIYCAAGAARVYRLRSQFRRGDFAKKRQLLQLWHRSLFRHPIYCAFVVARLRLKVFINQGIL